MQKKATRSRKKIRQLNERAAEEIYFLLRALQFKSGSRDAFNISFRLMIYLSFRSIIPKKKIVCRYNAWKHIFVYASRNYPLA